MPTNPKQFETAIGALMPGGWPRQTGKKVWQTFDTDAYGCQSESLQWKYEQPLPKR